ncbi:uncharacterized protein CXQ87_002208 [Candidozyma duobushaemuli]|uniref:CAP-Gly domain-containing protein n=2 Tax=Candidozyma TaxID=3303203 RepID=A0ABX8I378_9ASCO|nr:uncharacterized protein CXQ87_002208 [[Candida] duobushaemulonis]PVH14084.1 hypothetical protein CXQ87_002208 [[Candida] duobushaemulonis]QWU87720.1 hypothetical protein CA3LBN_001985 [[Candida] haemuloni]
MSELLGTKVAVPGTTRGFGVLKYIGPIEGKSGVFGGIELQGPIAASRGKNSGAVDGVQYFEVQQPMSGLFIPWERLRSSNARLPRYEDTIRPSNGFPDNLRTPSPTHKPLSRVSRPSSSSQSPQLAQPITLSKRRVTSGESVTRSVGGSRSDSGDLFDRTRTSYDADAARKEISELKAILGSKSRDLQERDNILAGLQNTVNELQAVLGDLEQELEQKNQKIAKQKADNDKAREEWRESLQLMMSAQQEAEELYEQQIQELRGDGQGEKTAELEKRLAALTEENNKLKEQASSASGDDAEEKKQELEKSLDRLQQDVASLEFVIQDSQKKVKERDARIHDLESELEEFKSKEVDGLSKQVRDLNVSDSKSNEKIEDLERQLEESKKESSTMEERVKKLEADLEQSRRETSQLQSKQTNSSDPDEIAKKVEDLQHELKMRPTFEELSELQTALEEVDSLHQKSMEDKDRALAAAEEQKKALAEQLDQLRSQQTQSKPEDPSEDKENSGPVSYVKNETLGIYRPPKPVDPSSGRSNWCGLCERDGHSSLNCPYENDIF